jgi:hypothetical protein
LAPSSRDRISVDLHGLKTALFLRAQALGVSPSGLVRTTLAEALGHCAPITTGRSASLRLSSDGERVRLCLRMSREQASATVEGARLAGLNPGDYVGNLVAGAPALMGARSRTDHIAALTASSAELSTLSRNINHLTVLLRQGDVQPAREYRRMLDTLGDDVRGHLSLAASILADLRPARPSGRNSEPRRPAAS